MHAYSISVGTVFSNTLAWVGIGAVPVSIAGFMLSRAVLGFGEAGNFPSAIKATAEYFPKKERALATGIFNSGSNVGAILAPLTVPLIALKWGWEVAFILVGAIGFIWMFFWLVFYDKPINQKRLTKAELDYITSEDEVTENDSKESFSWTKLLYYKQTWAFAFGKFMTDGIWWFFLFWLPKYLESQFNMKSTEIVLPLAVLYSLTMVGSICGGWFPIYFIKKGYNSYEARIKAMFYIALIPLVVLLAQPLGHICFWLPVLLIGIGASAHQAWSANIFTTVSDMFPKKAIASIIGIGGMAGGIGGVLVTKIGGALFDYYENLGHIETGYTIIFVICSVAYLVAWAGINYLVPKYKRIEDL
jgi:ACS family hexuronate transporter-like MFS transporter